MSVDRWYEFGLIAGLLGIALLVRYAALPHVTRDYTNFLADWYHYIDTHGGFLALRDKFSNYNVAYLYLLVGATYLPLPALPAIKLISVLFDLMLAVFIYRIVLLQHCARWVAGLAAMVVLLLPTVWMNSAMWAQADSIYAAFCVGGVYYLMRRRPWLAAMFIGTGVAFKLQAVFILPLLLALAVGRYVPWHVLLGLPAAYVAWALPALLVGHSPRDLLLVYLDQVDLTQKLTYNAPTVYQFFRIDFGTETLREVGVVFAGGLVLIILFVTFKSLWPFDAKRVLLLALLFAIVVPFFLPGMHERYFYLADVLSVAFAFSAARLFYVPLLVQVASALSYVAFLFRTEVYAVSVDQRFLSLLMFAALLLVLREFVQQCGLATLMTQSRLADAAPSLDRTASPGEPGAAPPIHRQPSLAVPKET